MSMDEYVMVVEARPLMDKFGIYRGLDALGGEVADYILATHSFMPRRLAEADPAYKQIIPYVTVRCEGLWLVFRRKAAQTEQRLHNKHSLGLGGHITREADTAPNPILAGLHRELAEEITLEHGEPRYLGVLNDDTNDVGRVHLGLLYEVRAKSRSFAMPEADKMDARWMDAGGVRACFDTMETWSQFVIEQLVIDLA
ncbi:MAG: hypothetical protein FWD98_01065 [Defluviitaleaceae bacterium]|nr:hypothetical protein [Defluviitaleaceae bacterium]